MKRIGLVMIMGVVVLSCQREEGSEPRLYSPMERMAVCHPIFVWESVGDMYHLQVSSDSSFASTVINEEELTDTTYTPEDTLEEARYYWRVRAKLDTWGEWSDIGSFFVVGPAWGLISPPDADTVKFPTLIWNTTENADAYRLFIYKGDTAAGRLILDTNLTDTSYTITNTLNPATYRWGVNAVMGEEEISYPEVRRFVTYTLDESYFPVGSDYVWKYMHVYSSWGRFGDAHDTSYYSVEVEEFVAEGEGLYVRLSKGYNFTGNEYMYRNDSVYFYQGSRLQSISLFPRDGEPMLDEGEPREDLIVNKTSDSTFCWGWGNGGEPYHDCWWTENWQKGKGMYLYNEGESYHYNSPDEEHPNGSWSRKDHLINLNRGE
jgi:hypothetical protein